MHFIKFLSNYNVAANIKPAVDFEYTMECIQKNNKGTKLNFIQEAKKEIGRFRAEGVVKGRIINSDDGMVTAISICAEGNESNLAPDIKKVTAQILNEDEKVEELLKNVTDFAIEYQPAMETWCIKKIMEYKRECMREGVTRKDIEKYVQNMYDKLSYDDFRKDLFELSDITKETRVAVLAKVDGFAINMQVLVDAASLQVKGCKLYLSDILSGKQLVNSDNEVSLEKSKILNATDHAVMNVLHGFCINITEDAKKLAFERAKRFLEVSEAQVKIQSSECIEDVLIELQSVAIVNAKLEAKNEELTSEQRRFKYDAKENTIAIRDNYLQKLLDELGTGYSKIIFCKKIRMLEAHRNEQIIITNRTGSGYGFNETGNIRYYKFRVQPEVEVA